MTACLINYCRIGDEMFPAGSSSRARFYWYFDMPNLGNLANQVVSKYSTSVCLSVIVLR